MNVKDVMGGAWMNKDDVIPGEVLRIARVSLVEDEKDGKARKQLVLNFKGKDKQFGLNVTNTSTLQELFGDETDDWLGQKVSLYIDPNVRDSKGVKVGGIRIRGAVAKPATPPPTADDDDDDDDEVPL